MSKKLEALFGMAPADTFAEVDSSDSTETETEIANAKEAIMTLDTAIDKIDTALPTVYDLNTSDAEMDAIADLATSTFKDLVDLAMNVEARFSGPILQSASTMLGHAVTTKIAKMDKKLKMVDLQLKKARLDLAAQTTPQAAKEAEAKGEGTVISRNDLIRAILAKDTKNDK